MRSPIAEGAVLAWRRLHTVYLGGALGVAALIVGATASWERAQAADVAADRALTGVTFGLALPLLGYLVVTQVTMRRRLDDAVLEVARFGADRRWASLGLLGVATGWLALAGGGLALLAVLMARGTQDPLLVGDLLVSSWLGVIAGVSYAWFLGMGASLGRRGGGRFGLLLLDWFLGAGTGVLATPWPRGHLRNLLGANPVLALSQNMAFAVIVGLLTLYVGIALWRTPK